MFETGDEAWYARGSKERPLTPADLPFRVVEAGVYWLRYADRLVELPYAPVGSLLALEMTSATGDLGSPPKSGSNGSSCCLDGGET